MPQPTQPQQPQSTQQSPPIPRRPPKVIEKKIHPQYFRSVRSGDKHFELRRDDDDAQINDVLYLREWDPDTKEYTGEFEVRRIKYILWGVPEYGLMEGYCIMSW